MFDMRHDTGHDPHDESCELAMDKMIDGIIDLAVHYRDHHGDDTPVAVTATAIFGATSTLVRMGIPDPVSVLTIQMLGARMARRGMVEEIEKAVEGAKSRGLASQIFGSILSAGAKDVPAEPGDVGSEGTSKEAPEHAGEATVDFTDLPDWMQRAFSERGTDEQA